MTPKTAAYDSNLLKKRSQQGTSNCMQIVHIKKQNMILKTRNEVALRRISRVIRNL